MSVVHRSDAEMLSKIELKARIIDVLTAHHTMTLATIRPDGFPQATTVNYVNEDLVVFFATDARSQKAGNIKLNTKVSVAITVQTEDFYKLSGLSMSGIAQRITDKDNAHKIMVSLFQRMPQSRRFVPEEDQQVAVYSINPVAFSFIDYAAGFGTSSLLEL